MGEIGSAYDVRDEHDDDVDGGLAVGACGVPDR